MENNFVLNQIIGNIERVIIGKREAIELVLLTLLCSGHVLIEDVPGVGKTSLVSSLAKSIDASFHRIQFTPDIMPTDITGFTLYNQRTGEFEYRSGAVMSQFILADEINRTSPKTQSSLLEVMEENQVTVDGTTYPVPKPFMVLATQNPVDYLGTFPLPEAQIDRFFMKISLGYPSNEHEVKMLSRFYAKSPLETLKPVATPEDIMKLKELITNIHVDTQISRYIVKITSYTREQEDVALGVSPRGSLCLLKAATAYAMYRGRDYVIPDDVAYMAPYVLNHRIIMRQEARFKNIDSFRIIDNALNTIRV